MRTHAVVGPAFARTIEHSPVLIFSPGGGLIREVYAAQMEELASQGYIVAAISHPNYAIVTVFPDARRIV